MMVALFVLILVAGLSVHAQPDAVGLRVGTAMIPPRADRSGNDVFRPNALSARWDLALGGTAGVVIPLNASFRLLADVGIDVVRSVGTQQWQTVVGINGTAVPATLRTTLSGWSVMPSAVGGIAYRWKPIVVAWESGLAAQWLVFASGRDEISTGPGFASTGRNDQPVDLETASAAVFWVSRARLGLALPVAEHSLEAAVEGTMWVGAMLPAYGLGLSLRLTPQWPANDVPRPPIELEDGERKSIVQVQRERSDTLWITEPWTAEGIPLTVRQESMDTTQTVIMDTILTEIITKYTAVRQLPRPFLSVIVEAALDTATASLRLGWTVYGGLSSVVRLRVLEGGSEVFVHEDTLAKGVVIMPLPEQGSLGDWQERTFTVHGQAKTSDGNRAEGLPVAITVRRLGGVSR